MSMRRFLANSLCKFPCRRSSVSCSLLYYNSLFPRFFGTRILCNINESEFDFNAYRLGKVSSINKALEESLPLKEPLKLHESMRYSLLSNSRRLGSTVCIACCELVGGTESTAMPITCAIEMLLITWMIADDLPCMDNDDFRRGKPSNRKVFGESMTILTSYSLIARAFENIAKATKLGVSSENIVRVLNESARLMIGAEGLSGGQAADLDCQGKPDIGIEQIEYILVHKASVGYEACAVTGAIVGGASEDEINRLRKYSKYVGLLHQIKDDIVDFEKDSIHGKATYPILIGKEKSMELLDKLLRKAEDQLEGFDPEKAAPLKALLYYFVQRPK